ncbi:nucleotide sugar dehydrogenase [Methanogenium organophilum]|uniref:UDP-N-acetyl-D-mannosamine dehydrogenase n=1 Tax=Methanogenium organophilum TaxID=2199 RepID=A0A9X9T731_METOG|nr:nucleotide sugar dehydrogenase [Methanogenium organophilum]WAI00310.1 nucleotide sugar dehydrogenase [Methanogenium organophilum]
MKNKTEVLLQKIQSGTITVGIIGLGYVGLPLAIAFANRVHVIGFDTNDDTIHTLNSGHSHILDVSDAAIHERISSGMFTVTSDSHNMERCDVIIICVPTPLTANKIPDLSYVKDACVNVSSNLKKGQLVILESTTYPGTTEEIVVPILEKSGLSAGIDFGVAYSPERIDPGNKQYTVSDIPKVIGGLTPENTKAAVSLYNIIIEDTVSVIDTRTAEAVKMIENIYRNVNIALANELALIFEHMGVDAWQAIDAAATKPYGFMPFYPGPGIGGHCIPLDPYYLSYQAKRYGFIPRFIETSGEINTFMLMHVVNLIDEGLKKAGITMSDASICVFGLAYKKNIDDTRESPAIPIIEELLRRGAVLKLYDPHVPAIYADGQKINSEIDIATALNSSECAVFLTDHEEFKTPETFRDLESSSVQVIVDCRNIFPKVPSGKVYLGIGKPHRVE